MAKLGFQDDPLPSFGAPGPCSKKSWAQNNVRANSSISFATKLWS